MIRARPSRQDRNQIRRPTSPAAPLTRAAYFWVSEVSVSSQNGDQLN